MLYNVADLDLWRARRAFDPRLAECACEDAEDVNCKGHYNVECPHVVKADDATHYRHVLIEAGVRKLWKAPWLTPGNRRCGRTNPDCMCPECTRPRLLGQARKAFDPQGCACEDTQAVRQAAHYNRDCAFYVTQVDAGLYRIILREAGQWDDALKMVCHIVPADDARKIVGDMKPVKVTPGASNDVITIRLKNKTPLAREADEVMRVWRKQQKV